MKKQILILAIFMLITNNNKKIIYIKISYINYLI